MGRNFSGSRARTGTARVVVTGEAVTLRIPITRTPEKSSASASTNASRSAARRNTQGTETSGGEYSKSEDSRPDSPKVDIGHKAYKVFRNGDRLLIRFSVGQLPTGIRGVRGNTGPYYVWDMDTGKVAAKTSKTGYADKKEAMRIAREYRDRYGAYVRFKF